MRLFVNARFLTQPTSGVQRYARELLGALDRRLEVDARLREELGNVIALHPGEVDDPGWTRIKLRHLRGGSGHFWEQGALWRATRDGVLLSLCNSGPVLHRAQILTLHDANMYQIPEAYKCSYRYWHKLLRPVLARQAAALTTVSRYSAASLGRYLRVPAKRFSIVPNSAGHVLRGVADRLALTNWGLTPGSYWLTVGNQSPNKNIARLVAAHGSLGDLVPPLVVAGAHAPGLATGEDTVGARFLGRVSDGELISLYQGAAGFVFPSRFEGFGIPPLEAMSIGVPVLAARAAAMPEILGDAVMWFDPLSVRDIADTMRCFVQVSPNKCAAMVSAGYARAALYSWDQSAERLVSVLRGVLLQKSVGLSDLSLGVTGNFDGPESDLGEHCRQ